MNTPTIEDVLEKYIYKNIEGFGDGLTVEGAEAACKELASLQTPSNEKYWRESDVVEFAEWIKDNWIVGTGGGKWRRQVDYRDQRTSETLFEEYQIYKQSTPIPIQTPCVELEKEVERLKGLLEQEVVKHYISKRLRAEQWGIFKTENNI